MGLVEEATQLAHESTTLLTVSLALSLTLTVLPTLGVAVATASEKLLREPAEP